MGGNPDPSDPFNPYASAFSSSAGPPGGSPPAQPLLYEAPPPEKPKPNIRRWLVIASGALMCLISLSRVLGFDRYLAGRGLGQQCDNGDQCRSGKCLSFSWVSGFCTETCWSNKECPGMRCYQDRCVPRATLGIGEDCRHSLECTSSLCLFYQGGDPHVAAWTPGQCSQRCVKDSSCPEGFSCIEVANDDKACISKLRLHEVDQDLRM